jgi:hypothetical protein
MQASDLHPIWHQALNNLQFPALTQAEKRITDDPPGTCAYPGCEAEGEPLHLDSGETIWYCAEHLTSAGFCGRCHTYVADVEVDRVMLTLHGCCHKCWMDIHGAG